MTPEWMVYARTILALVFVIGLIFLLASAARKYGLGKRLAGNPKTPPRLSVSETLYLDPKHRLVIVQDGGREHLLLIGPAGDLIIESREGSTTHG